MAFRFGLIGAGAVSETHVLAMRSLPEVELVAVADVDRDRAKALAQRYSIPQVHESVEALLEGSSVDAVSIVTPHHHHLPAARAAAHAKKHVLAEKAIADSVPAADQMIAVCQSEGVTLGGILQNRFTAAAGSLKQAVESGSLGRIFLASITVKLRRSSEYFQRGPWRGRKGEGGGGTLITNGVHTLDLLQWTLGMPSRIFGRTATVLHPIEVEDLAVGVLEWANGATAVVQVTTGVFPENPSEVEVHGERGSAALFESRGYLGYWASSLDKPTSLRERWSSYASHYHEQDAAVPSQAAPEPHAESIRDFVAAVREGRRPLVDGEEARKALLLVDALYRSARENGWVEIARLDGEAG